MPRHAAARAKMCGSAHSGVQYCCACAGCCAYVRLPRRRYVLKTAVRARCAARGRARRAQMRRVPREIQPKRASAAPVSRSFAAVARLFARRPPAFCLTIFFRTPFILILLPLLPLFANTRLPAHARLLPIPHVSSPDHFLPFLLLRSAQRASAARGECCFIFRRLHAARCRLLPLRRYYAAADGRRQVFLFACHFMP